MDRPSRNAVSVAQFLLTHAAYLESQDMRVGQFISNECQFAGYDGDCYYVENDALLQGMRAFINEMQKWEVKG